MISFKKLLQISRPRFWIYGLGPFLLAIAHLVRVDAVYSIPIMVVFGIFFTLPANLLVYGVNDIFDQETDALNPKKDSYENRLQKNEIVPLFYVIIFLLAPFILIEILAGDLPSLLIFLSTLFLLVFYSAPPLRFKNIPLVDSMVNGLMSVAPFIFALVFVGQPLPLITIVAGGLWAMALHIFSAIPDIAADTQAGLTTTATWLGEKKSLVFVSTLLVSSIALGAIFATPALLLIGLPYLIIFMLPLWKSHSLFSLYKKIPLVTFVSGTLLFFMILFL